LVLITVFMNLTMSLLVEYFSIYEDNKKISFYQRFIANFVFESPTLIIWLAFYYFWQYIQLNKKKELEELNLKANLKELELKNIKYHINPHFIFNALNCIRALVDENPNLARDGITKLSHILRKSLQSNKDELIEIEEELKIVQDYLDLEKIRFDHKLEVETIINKDVLHFKMPIMMLQMMVENAIKHGISKQTTIGKIKIEIINKVDLIEIFVGNTGVFKVAETNSEVGFGISSTVNRLKFLYANKAIFSINNTSENWVEAKIIIPKTNKI
ncbi:MAG: histidine kinase, partial [Sediminibacterium sp.]|nr:histidine kinase [Sediminibacterium sp.]